MKFNSLFLILSFTVGIVYMMFTVPRPKVIVKFPTPDVSESDIFSTAQGSCYKLASKQVPCPKDGKHVLSQPVGDHEELKEDNDWFSISKFADNIKNV